MVGMKTKYFALIGLVVLLISISCNLSANVPAVKTQEDPATKAPAGIETSETAATKAPDVLETAQTAPTNIPGLVNEGSGPAGFSANATSSESVILAWQAVAEAESYRIRMSSGSVDIFEVIDLPASVTSYEDFLAPADLQITYAVQAVAKSGFIGQSVAAVKTPAGKPNPLHVLVEYADSAAVTQVIGPAGGSITVDAQGVVYELSIPPGALEIDTEVKLTPVKDLTNWPLDGKMIGVVGIEPEGLWLNAPASLKITPAAGIADTSLAHTGFTYAGFGSEFSLAPIALAKAPSAAIPLNGVQTVSQRLAAPAAGFLDSLSLWLPSFGPAGVGEISPEQARKITREHPPSDSDRNLEQKLAAVGIGEEELAPLLSNMELKILRLFEETRREIAQADNCSKLSSAIFHFDVNLSVSEKLGKPADAARNEAYKNAIWDDLTKRTKEIIDQASADCEKKSDPAVQKPKQSSCTERLLRAVEVGLTPFFKEYQKRMIDRYGAKGVGEPREKFDRSCVTGYVMQGGTDGMKVSNTYVCLNQGSFTANGSVYGGSILLTFVPNPAKSESELPSGGSYTYTGSAEGMGLNGEGTFTLLGKVDGPIKLEAFGPGTVDDAGGSGAESYLLTPKGHFCAKP
jgi:hypothetical protein